MKELNVCEVPHPLPKLYGKNGGKSLVLRRACACAFVSRDDDDDEWYDFLGNKTSNP